MQTGLFLQDIRQPKNVARSNIATSSHVDELNQSKIGYLGDLLALPDFGLPFFGAAAFEIGDLPDFPSSLVLFLVDHGLLSSIRMNGLLDRLSKNISASRLVLNPDEREKRNHCRPTRNSGIHRENEAT
jgi:hypothetical protein